jgi:hypothetical protein
MATFGSTPPRDPLAAMKLAISDMEMLHADALAAFEDVNASWACDSRKDATTPRAERYEPISQARQDDAALPMTRFGEYPD